MKLLIGYRIPGFQSSQVTDPVAIAIYENREFRNTDIQAMLYKKRLIKSPTLREAVAYLNRKKKDGYIGAVWVCKSKKECIRHYSDEDSPADSLERWSFTDYVIISDLGDDGILVIYRGWPKSTRVQYVTVKSSDIPKSPWWG